MLPRRHGIKKLDAITNLVSTKGPKVGGRPGLLRERPDRVCNPLIHILVDNWTVTAKLENDLARRLALDSYCFALNPKGLELSPIKNA